MGIRLNKATTNLNIGLQTAVEFLKSHHIGELKEDAGPNTKITDEQYDALVKYFSVDKKVKAKAATLFDKVSNNNQESKGGKAKKKKKKRSSTPVEISIETKLKWAEQRKNRRSLKPNKTFTRSDSPVTAQRKDVRTLKEINRIHDIDEALWCFTWPTLKYNRSDDWYVQDLIGHNEEMMAYYHSKMKGYFGLEHVLQKQYVKKDKTINVSIKDIYIPQNTSVEPEYSELWLPQPLATMVVRGLTRILKWPNLAEYEYGQKVLIYALHTTRRMRKFIWADDALYSSYHNALQMGNLSENEMPEHVYVGYVVIGKKATNGYYEIQESTAFKTIASSRPKYLNNLGEDKRILKQLSLEHRALKIPVNDDAWPMLEHHDGTFYFYWEDSFNDYYSNESGCGDSKGLYEIVLYNDKKEIVCAQEDKAAITKETYVSEPDEKEFEAFVINFGYIREKSKYEDSSFNVMKRIEWILDWNCVKFKSGYFVVFPPDDGKVKFKPKAFPYRGVGESFNYLREYLNDRLNPVRCYVEAMDLTIYDKITLEAAIQKFAVLSKQRAITTNATKQPPREAPDQMSFKQALSKAAQMTPEEFEKYKSDYINFLVKMQSENYKVIPCVERLAHANSDMTEYAFLFSIKCSSGKILIIHENVNPDRATLLFLVKEENFNKSIREIYDFLQSAEINKRSSLRGKNIEIEDAGILSYRSINHDDLYSWKQTINTYKRYR
jgi:hypothetical protein